jgi:hypothetical protein
MHDHHWWNLSKLTAYHRTAAIVMAAERSVEFGLVGRGVVMHLPQAAGVRRLSGDSQGQRGKSADEQ